ncbi:MAG: hypothetical protein PF588_00710 [Candidatus Kapabacteria bacterium]|jgi:hypothetical protein|nr:hypothetical protein [Candidatus Kapabacteria bacterium]
MKNILKICVSLIIFGLAMNISVNAQDGDPTKSQMENVLKSFKNYRFGTINIYKVKNLSELRRALEAKEMADNPIKIDEKILEKFDNQMKTLVKGEVEAESSAIEIADQILNQGLPLPSTEELDQLVAYYVATKIGVKERYEHSYLITSRAAYGEVPEHIIGMLVSKKNISNMEKVLKNVSNDDIYTYDELKLFPLDSSFASENLYGLMEEVIVQRNYENRTLEAQGLGKTTWFTDRKYGVARSLSSKYLNTSDVQKFVRISEGQPGDMELKRNEVVLSPDLVSWRRYPLPGWDDGEGFIVDSFSYSNVALPEIGFELRYGMDEINFPSFWSERVSASAVWQGTKLGLILPTDGWAHLSKDVADQDRRLTHGGIGLTGSFDFPMKVIPKSGVFHFAGGVIFGDAEEASYKNRNLESSSFIFDNKEDSDFLVRYDAQLHYTFGMAVDYDYWLRFGLGATVYSMEMWNYQGTADEFEFKMNGSETIGGISGKVEFMKKSGTTPFGASIQYFDEALGTNIWLQIPIIDNTLAIRLDAKGYFVAFRDRHKWEDYSVIMPMVRLIVNF